MKYVDLAGNEAMPPFNAPQGILAWIEIPTGNVYLLSDYQWVDPDEPVRGKIINRAIKFLAPGPEQGTLLAYHVMFIQVYYKHQYPVFHLDYATFEQSGEFGDDDMIY